MRASFVAILVVLLPASAAFSYLVLPRLQSGSLLSNTKSASTYPAATLEDIVAG